MRYKDRLLSHLDSYRRDVLRIPKPGTFTYRGRDVPVKHVLPKSEAWLGIPEEVRDQVKSFVGANGVKLHRYFHHLNSSQAFALSLFVPFFEGGDAARSSLLRAIGSATSISTWAPEHVPNHREGTNLDAWWQASTGEQYFCEVKLTEDEFGTARPDTAHETKRVKTYEPLLRQHIRPARLASPAFFSSYQILRNLWHAAGTSDGHVVFLFPRQHKVLSELLEPVLADITSDLWDRVHVAHAEDVLARVRSDEACPDDLRRYAGHLASKYLLDTP